MPWRFTWQAIYFCQTGAGTLSKMELIKSDVRVGRIGGCLFRGNGKGPTLVLFNQWRSGARSILSKYIAELVLAGDTYGAVLFIDRVASGGVSDNKLTGEELKRMKTEGEFQFGAEYTEAISKILNKEKFSDQFVLGGSSGGAPAVLAVAESIPQENRRNLLRVVLVEPAGLRTHGLGKKGVASIPHAIVRQAWAYRHRLQRGWWTPMDREQYFAKGSIFEKRARFFSGNSVYLRLLEDLQNPDLPPLQLVLSTKSHVHRPAEVKVLHDLVKPPHRIVSVSDIHDRVCQPPSLSSIYLKAI